MLANRITLLRRAMGLSQLQLAQKLSISPSALGMYEQSRRTPSLDLLIAMSKIFNVSLDYLITGSEFTPNSTAQIFPNFPYAPVVPIATERKADFYFYVAGSTRMNAYPIIEMIITRIIIITAIITRATQPPDARKPMNFSIASAVAFAASRSNSAAFLDASAAARAACCAALLLACAVFIEARVASLDAFAAC